MLSAETPHTESKTPILDVGIFPAPVRRASNWSVLAASGIGFLSVFVLVMVGEQADHNVNFSLSCLLAIAAFFVAIIVHELGHLVAGWAMGFRFNSFSVGPFSLHLEHGALNMRFGSKGPGAGYADMQLNRVGRLRRRLLIYGLAGSAANLLSVPATVLLVNYVFPKLSPTWIATFAAQFLVVSLIFAALNVVPKGEKSISDGSRIWILLRLPEQAKRLISVAAVGSLHAQGIRPRDWKRTWLKSATFLRDNSIDELYGNWLAYIGENDRKNLSGAETTLERCLELSDLVWPSLRDQIAHESAVYTAWFREDEVLAKKWLAQVKKPKHIAPLQTIRVECSLRCARRDFPSALNIWEEGLTLIKKVSGPEGKQLLESWQDWQVEIQERQSQIGIA